MLVVPNDTGVVLMPILVAPIFVVYVAPEPIGLQFAPNTPHLYPLEQ